MTLCITTFHVYRGIYVYVRPSSLDGIGSSTPYAKKNVDDDYDYEYVGDTSGDAVRVEKSNNNFDAKIDRDSDLRQEQNFRLNDLLHVTKDEHEKKQTNKTMPPFPIFDLSESAMWDAFGILENINEDKKGEIGTNNQHKKQRDGESFWQMAHNLRRRFAEFYGGENAARMLLDRGTTTFSGIDSNGTDSIAINRMERNNKMMSQPKPPPDVVATACRLHRAKTENRSFRMAFGGYSVTAGRGNKHHDSYPFQLQEILEPILKAAGFAAPLLITNAAIGGVPSFPYGWCMKEFWGGQNIKEDSDKANGNPDVVSWDFGMNEASGGPEGLEAYVRHLISTYSDLTLSSIPPKLIVKDYFTAIHRKEVLTEYYSILKDPLILHTDHAVETMFEATKTASSTEIDGDQDWRRPPGFRRWREWGAPKGAPGQAPHHPAVQEHRLNAWILAMHFVAALEYMVAIEENTEISSHNWCPATRTAKDSSSALLLPRPVSRKIANDTKLPYDSIFFGYPLGTEMNETHKGEVKHDTLPSKSWRMNPIRCRTTFEPTFSGDLSEIIVNGTVGEDLNPILPKSQYYYNKGWTYDLSDAERAAKRKLNLYRDGLGFKDSKEAYYGIYESPPMTLLLPYESGTAVATSSLSSSLVPQVGDPAEDWYESIVLCQVNDKNTLDSAFSDPNSCDFGNDVGIRIGGIDVFQNITKMFRMIGSVYLGKPICKHVSIPSQARLTSHNTLLHEGDAGIRRGALGGDDTLYGSRLLKIDQTGLLVEVFVSNPHIVHVNQACSLSHVVWEERHSAKRLRPRKDETEEEMTKK